MFHARGGELSLGDDVLEGLASKTFTSPSADNWRKSCIPTQLLKVAKGNADLINKAWLSMLASPGLVVKFKPQAEKAMIVLETSRWGFIAWPLRVCKNDQGGKFFMLQDFAEPEYHFIFNETQWLACNITPTYTTVNVASASAPVWESCVVLTPGEPSHLLKVAARLAFTSMTVPFLQKLVDHLRVLAEASMPSHCLEF